MRIALSLAAAMTVAASHAVVLYDPATMLFPDHASWGWTHGGFGAATSVGGGLLEFDTRMNATIQDGWGMVTPFSLDPNQGFSVKWQARIHAQIIEPSADVNGDGLADRAGLSFIILDSNHRGIEVSMWQNEVWIQQETPLFTHSTFDERHFMDMSNQLHNFEAIINGPSYELLVDGVSAMGGPTHDYSAFAGFPDPYETNNFLFVGDNTSSAGASSTIGRIEASVVPEPATLTLLGVGLAALARRRRR